MGATNKFKFQALALIAFAQCFSLGCSGKGNITRAAVESRIFIEGDPRELIAGTTQNQKSFFSTSNLSNFDNARLVGAEAYIQAQQNGDIYGGDANGDEPLEDGFPIFALSAEKLIGGQSYVDFEGYSEDSNSGYPYGLRFKRVGNEYQLSHTLVYSMGQWQAEPVSEVYHYSKSSDGLRFSLLFSAVDDDYGTVLYALQFDRSETSIFDSALKYTDYKFIFDRFLALGSPETSWSQNSAVELSICGARANQIAQVIRDGIAPWQSALTHRLSISIVSRATQYPPFSDVNTNCIFAVDDYLMGDDESRVVGLAPTHSKGEDIGSGYMFLFSGNIEELTGLSLTDARLYILLKPIVMHEVGHLLGLGHQFDGTESIMSYDFVEVAGALPDYQSLKAYDTEAIQHLYPALNN